MRHTSDVRLRVLHPCLNRWRRRSNCESALVPAADAVADRRSLRNEARPPSGR